MTAVAAAGTGVLPLLLFNGECAVCRQIAHWVAASGAADSRNATIVVRPIGDDPAALRALNPALDIWDAYATIHLLMPDGSMLVGGEAVAETLRRLPNCRWFAWLFRVKIAGMRPFQAILSLGYTVLADVRPVLGCESCGMPSPLAKFVGTIVRRVRGASANATSAERRPHASPRPSRG